MPMDADLVELEKGIVGAGIGLNPDNVTDWELQKSHGDLCLLTHRNLDTLTP